MSRPCRTFPRARRNLLKAGRSGAGDPGKTLVPGEPDNYLGLQQVQPWLSEAVDESLRADGPQVVLTSHHPDALNLVAVDRGWSMVREDSGPTRIKCFEVSEGARWR